MNDRNDPHPSPAPHVDVTGLLQRAEQGDTEALGAAFEAVGTELRHIAASALRRNPGDGLLQATALVHESFIKTAEACAADGLSERAHWQDRAHFVRSQMETMRNLLVDAARRRGALRRGGGAMSMVANEESLGLASPPDDTLFVNDACEELRKRDPLAAALAELHYFGGLTWSEAGALLGLPDRVRKRMTRRADVWFVEQLEGRDPGPGR